MYTLNINALNNSIKNKFKSNCGKLDIVANGGDLLMSITLYYFIWISAWSPFFYLVCLWKHSLAKAFYSTSWEQFSINVFSDLVIEKPNSSTFEAWKVSLKSAFCCLPKTPVRLSSRYPLLLPILSYLIYSFSGSDSRDRLWNKLYT